MPQLTKNIFDELTENIRGDVYTDAVRRYLHSTDGSIFRVEPACVVYPQDTTDVVEAVRFANKYGLSVHSRGAGSGLCGSAVGRGIILDFAKYMNQLIEIDEQGKTFVCQPGYRFGELEVALKGKGLFFPPDPSSGEYATFGGMYGTNASGAHSVKYGNVSDYIEDAEFVTSEGKVYTFSQIASTDYNSLDEPFRKLFDLYSDNKEQIEQGYPPVRYNVSGYNLRSLVDSGKLNLGKLIGGSEGTLVITTRLKFRLHKKPTHDSLVVAYFDNIINSAKATQAILPMNPAGIEIMDKSLLKFAKESDAKLNDAIPDGYDNVCMFEFDGYSEEETTALAEKAKAILEEQNLSPLMYTAASEEEKEKFWAVRKAAVPILYKIKGERKILALIEDAAVPTDRLVEYFEGLYEILERNEAKFVIYGHIAKGLLHTRPLLNLKDPNDIELLRILADEVFTLVNRLGGAVSGEHGDGRLRSKYIKMQYGNLYDIFMQTKEILDSGKLLNPEIKTQHDDNQMMKNLRYGKEYSSVDIPNKNLKWSEGFVEEAEKCHGCSKCTTVTTATRMCPVYKVTRDEYSAPKAKANILRALLSGAVDDRALYEEALQEVISHCVNCGSCHIECPSAVNIPKLSIEARSHYVSKFGVSLTDRIPTKLEDMGRNLRKVTWLLEPVMKHKFARNIMEVVSGIASEREFVPLAKNSLYDRLKERSKLKSDRKVLYFAGCYASYVRPQIGEAMIKVLEAAGMEVIVPEQHCCGIPHLSKGLTDGAKEKLEANRKSWGALLDEVDYVVATCTSCGLSLYKEWGFLSDDEFTRKVKSKLIHISTLVNMNMDKLEFSDKKLHLAYHKSCHMRSLPDNHSSVKMLSCLKGAVVEDLASNCCGMAGSWGMKADNYDLSTKIGTPMTDKLKMSDADVGVTDCPTCTMQMEHMSMKEVKHPIEVMAECLK
ncbi:anaerobic glycerol-3-phosphate dehydrogenase subunit C [Seleniivibrio woodruffii]|uniref:D-lactate dehydrogenase (cytochrome) n=1 Tax=Seleniivibrio woodruffii TaxID=1078050 RepID=A0A4R1K3B6_9BACT|nr:anaerobic glycerol-3-phosphate dehydrogenase subunit C [Seleniivibrio woodruffii]TCK58347.1 FAD/FMN-containing dehydrogenase [Seleniivibrio woodruffii]TVZ36721.1 FAD/FMN-containing dehydrogenase [Seleniivibrio woodruffii]